MPDGKDDGATRVEFQPRRLLAEIRLHDVLEHIEAHAPTASGQGPESRPSELRRLAAELKSELLAMARWFSKT
jgi:hypothetical protein